MNKFLSISFIFLLLSCSNKNSVIGIQPIGSVKSVYCDSVKSALEAVYGTEILILPKIEIPEHTFVNIKSPRYRADKLIKYLKENQKEDIDFTIGLISKDISTTKRTADGEIKKPISKYEDWGIFGLGYRPGPSCLVSTYRLKNTNDKLFYSRLKKIAVHEIGHNLGLPHCPDSECVMQDAAESISTIDNVSMILCNKCKRKI